MSATKTHSQLWRSDGTTAGTTLVKEFGQRISGTPRPSAASSTSPPTTAFTPGCGEATARRPGRCWSRNSGIPLFGSPTWPAPSSSPPTTAPTPGCGEATAPRRGRPWSRRGCAAIDLTAVGGTLYFTTVDYGVNSQLWRSDGTEAGTTPITSVGPTPEADALYPSLTAVGGTLYFVRNGPPAGYLGATLMRTDGTPSGTRELRSGIIPRQLTAVGNTLYFEGYDTKHGNELWRSDGTPHGDAAGQGHPARRAQRHLLDLTAVGKTLFFSANDGGTALSCGGPDQSRARRPRGSARRGRTPRSRFGRKAAIRIVALASLFVAALVTPTAQAASRYYYFQVYPGSRGVRISFVVVYKNQHRHGRYTPRQANYEATVSALSCSPPMAMAQAYVGVFGHDMIKLEREGSPTRTRPKSSADTGNRLATSMKPRRAK